MRISALNYNILRYFANFIIKFFKNLSTFMSSPFYISNNQYIKKIKSLEWVKEGLSVLIILTAKEIFYWEEKHIFEMGMSAPRFSLGLKMFVQSVVLPERLFEESPVYWNNLFNFGHIDPVEYNEKAQQAVLQIHDYKKTHPLICKYHAGYIHGLSQFALKSKKIEIEETKCIYKGDEYSEYVISWD